MNQPDYYKALMSRKEEIQEQIERKRDLLQQPMAEQTDELSGYDQHPGDLGSDTFEREKELGLLEMLEAEMTKVEDALANLEHGSYGVCDQCGKPIEAGRLKRMVNTTLCAACARGQSDHFQRPAEEGVLRPSKQYNAGFDIAGYSVDEYKDSDTW
jgi:YteA family regulatory protein